MTDPVRLIQADCLDALRLMPEASVHAIVTDPPYGISFMGKRWDYSVPSVEIWAECLRVLKPGGHLLAFAATRTQHRMAARIEDAGFEIRDMIAWVYGSGFPKSLDVSKAIDKMDASEEQERRRLRFTDWVRSTGVTSRQINEATGTNMGGHYTTAASQPAIMTREHLESCRHLLGDVPEWVEREADIRSVESRNMAEREVVGQKTAGIPFAREQDRDTVGASQVVAVDITAPATPAAQQWSGWGTALKPALEPITVARKPLCGTVAENVLAHGTGGINVDGCRVAHNEECRMMAPSQANIDNPREKHRQAGRRKAVLELKPQGRWPANLIHDGSEEVVGLFRHQQSGAGQDSCSAPRGADSGNAARFFYTPKADKRQRQCVSHPTVKPLDLMAYLCRLVTPPGGTVLDPFMGTGSTIKAALSEGFYAIGIERDPAYFVMAEQRLDGAQLGIGLHLSPPNP